MITSLGLFEGRSVDPYYNLAVEQVLLESVQEGQCILYLWQNENTVVIGRNQNPWKECRTTLLSEEGGRLARRLSGGGAVFHDTGNLNFTFLLRQEDYDVDRQLSVIQQALRKMGLPAEKSGRNDLLVYGRKFSGNAFYKHDGRAYHHGTLLVDVDMNKLGRYLNPSKAKLRAKGVDSVRSRVANLTEFSPELTIEMLKTALAEAFSQVYGLPALPVDPPDAAAVEALRQRNESWQWNFGQKLALSTIWETRFPWGEVQITAGVENGLIQEVRVYSDAMDWQLPGRLEALLLGARFEKEAICARLRAEAPDVALWLESEWEENL